MNEWMNGWMNEWMNGWIIYTFISVSSGLMVVDREGLKRKNLVSNAVQVLAKLSATYSDSTS